MDKDSSAKLLAAREAEQEKKAADEAVAAEAQRLADEAAAAEAQRLADEQARQQQQQYVAPPPPVQPQAPSSVYYANCSAARAAGAAPVYAGSPGYGRHLDRDGDGIGCE